MYQPLIEQRYKQGAEIYRSGRDWSGLGSDLLKDRTVWLRVLDKGPGQEESLRVWKATTALTGRLGPCFTHPSPPRQDQAGRAYQVSDIPQSKWSNLSYLMQRKHLGWDGASVLIEQLASQVAQAEAAGLQPQGNLRSQILIDHSGEILICGHWEQSVRNGWAGPVLLEMLEDLAGSEGEGKAALQQLRSRQVVGRLKSALTVASTMQGETISPSRARRQIKEWLKDPEPKRRVGPWLALPLIAGAIFAVSQLLPLPPRYVPDLVGASRSEAEKELAGSDWKTQIRNMPSQYRAGQVIGQSPAPGSKLRSGGKVILKVATPKLTAEVPPLKGLDPDTARDILAANGLRMKEYFTTAGPSNRIQSTRPQQGTRVRQGEVVTVTLAP